MWKLPCKTLEGCSRDGNEADKALLSEILFKNKIYVIKGGGGEIHPTNEELKQDTYYRTVLNYTGFFLLFIISIQ